MRIPIIVATIVVAGLLHARCYAGCNCDDWMQKGGYCVDYIKTQIPAFPIPQNATEIEALKNKDISDVEEGDVAIFNLGSYWHVAYVEKVYPDQQGNAAAIDVTEMNFGGQLSFGEFRNTWKQKSRSEWKRALCCGITDNYGQAGSRKNVALNTVTQIWSPDETVFDKVREVFNEFIQFTGREL